MVLYSKVGIQDVREKHSCECTLSGVAAGALNILAE